MSTHGASEFSLGSRTASFDTDSGTEASRSEASDGDIEDDRTVTIEEILALTEARFLRVGCWMGMALAGIGMISWQQFRNQLLEREDTLPCLYGAADANQTTWQIAHYSSVYHDAGLLALFPACWAFLLYSWQSLQCDYLSILKLDPQKANFFHEQAVFAAKLGLIWACCTFSFWKTIQCDLAFAALRPVANYMPGFMLIALLSFATWCWRLRLLPMLWKSVTSPIFGPVGELDSYVANWLTSLVKPIQGVAFGICLYPSGEFLHGGPTTDGMCSSLFFHGKSFFSPGNLILILPNILRVAQNLRQAADKKQRHPPITNACKYMLGVLVTLFGIVHDHKVTPANHPIFFWIWSSIIMAKASYSFLWDITEDWHLFTSSNTFLCLPCGKVRLREKRLFRTVLPYILGMLANFVARFISVFNLVPSGSFGFQHQLIDNILYWAPLIEILRRTMWSVFKVEYKELQTQKTAHPLLLQRKTRLELKVEETELKKNTTREILVVLLVATGVIVAIYDTKEL